MDRRMTVAVGIVGVHLVVHIAHGVVHELVPVRLSPIQLAVIVGVVFIGPLLGVSLLLRDYRWWGGALIMLTGVLALGVEGGLHFIVSNPDNVAHVHEAQLAFGTTAVLSVLTDAVVAIVGMSIWREESRQFR